MACRNCSSRFFRSVTSRMMPMGSGYFPAVHYERNCSTRRQTGRRPCVLARKARTAEKYAVVISLKRLHGVRELSQQKFREVSPINLPPGPPNILFGRGRKVSMTP
jgi:hypothetical protein